VPTLLLLDGHSLAYRAFYALPAENFSTSTGQNTNAVYGFTSMLINMLRDEQPTHIAVAFDKSRQTFRSEEYAEYKAGRSATPTEFSGQIPLVHEVLQALRIPFVESEGYEADDLIATLTTQAEAAGMDVLICSGDRDAFQLVSDKVTLLYPVRGVSEVWRMTPDKVEEKYGVRPERYSDLAALVGESSDNLPGVPGVGPKTAAKWLGQYGDLTGLVAHVDEIKGKAGDSLREHLDGVLRNRRLNQLVRDVELGVDVEDLARTNWDREEVHRVFDGLEFRVLRDRLFEYLEPVEAESQGGFDLDTNVLGSEDVTGWLEHHAPKGSRVGVHVVGTWGRGTGDASAVAMATPDGVAGFIPLIDLDEEAEAALASWAGDPERHKVLHDAKGPMHALAARGIPLKGVSTDTALAAYLVRPDQRSYDLADLVLRHVGRDLKPEAAAQPQGMLDFAADDDAAADEAMVRARAVLDLADALSQQLDDTGGTALMADIELPLVDVLVDMERNGIAADLAGLTSLEADFAGKMAAAQADAYAAIDGEQINLGSPKQLQEVLFDQLGCRRPSGPRPATPRRRCAQRPLRQDRAPLPRGPAAPPRHGAPARDRRGADQVGRRRRAHPHDLHPDDRGHRAALLDRPQPAERADPHRGGAADPRGLRRRDGFESLMSATTARSRCGSWRTCPGTTGLIEAFRTGEDLHRFVGSRVFGVEPADVTAEMRSKVKAMSYGLAYGLSAFGLSKQLGISTGEARASWTSTLPASAGCATTCAMSSSRRGSRVHRDDARATPLPARPDERQPAAARDGRADGPQRPHPGLGADIMKVAMLGVDRELTASGDALPDASPGARRTRAGGGVGGARRS
jgi:DNA polymerase-1